MTCNRDIYLSCPEVPAFSELFLRKFRSWFHRQCAETGGLSGGQHRKE
jgi:hypothetical protein